MKPKNIPVSGSEAEESVLDRPYDGPEPDFPSNSDDLFPYERWSKRDLDNKGDFLVEPDYDLWVSK